MDSPHNHRSALSRTAWNTRLGPNGESVGLRAVLVCVNVVVSARLTENCLLLMLALSSALLSRSRPATKDQVPSTNALILRLARNLMNSTTTTVT